MPEKIEGAAVCTLNSNIYIIGGHNNESYFKSVFAYCMETKKWVSVADMNSPRACSGNITIILLLQFLSCFIIDVYVCIYFFYY